MHERRRLKGMTRGFAGHFAGGDPAQLGIDQGEQILGGSRIAVFNGVEDARNVAHSAQGSGAKCGYNVNPFTA